MATARKLDIKNHLLRNTKVLGNSGESIPQLCSHLLKQFCQNKKAIGTVADGTYLSPQTILRMMDLSESELGEPYNPGNDTMERILKFFNVEFTSDQVAISARNQNKPKATY